MKAYTGFASVYDQFMDNLDYDGWCKYLLDILKKYNVNPSGNYFQNNILLDLGCGTGNITERLAKAGFDMIGVDGSEQMLQIAQEKNHDGILYLLQDMRAFELYGTVAAIVSLGDSMNYITEYEDLVQVFRLVNNYLDPNGVFVFDLKTEYLFSNIGDAIIADDRDEVSLIWDNHYNQTERINEYDVSVFIKDDDGRYDKITERHFQRAYRLEEIKDALKKAGLIFETAYEAFTYNTPNEDSERIYVIAREHGKNMEVDK